VPRDTHHGQSHRDADPWATGGGAADPSAPVTVASVQLEAKHLPGPPSDPQPDATVVHEWKLPSPCTRRVAPPPPVLAKLALRYAVILPAQEVGPHLCTRHVGCDFP